MRPKSVDELLILAEHVDGRSVTGSVGEMRLMVADDDHEAIRGRLRLEVAMEHAPVVPEMLQKPGSSGAACLDRPVV